MRPVVVQGTVVLAARGSGLGRPAFVRATGKRLLESIHCTDGQELLVLDRGKPYVYRWESIYGTVTTRVPLASIRGVDRRDADEATGLTIRTDGGDVPCAFARTNASVEAYHDYLSQVAATTSH